MGSDTAWTEGPALSAWIYNSPRGAAAGTVRLHRLSRRGAVVVVDAASVTWVRGAHRPLIAHPRLRTMSDRGGASPLGMLLRRLVRADSDATGDLRALAAELRGTGLSEDFLRQLRDCLAPDSSALVVVSLAADAAEVQLVIERGKARGDVRLCHVSLTRAGLAVLGARVGTASSASRRGAVLHAHGSPVGKRVPRGRAT